ncbi:hypothetical protein L1987_48726 [Smallanthus sonchifolius]|uniref:Uncharacterized protein n=1 Tax=Smallanthus sonchifolius TaxID=185202 RepID=A0ACB9FTN8_9ASTR|nr:hypothetical protein L1987_48726 [Smallanthus sonchifolius]
MENLLPLPSRRSELTYASMMLENNPLQREDGSLENIKEYDSLSNSSPKIFSSQDRQWLIINNMENIETFEAQEMQSKIRNIFKETLKRKVEALDRQPIKDQISILKRQTGKMHVIEEEVQRDVSEHISTDPHSIIIETNMPLGLADEIEQRIQEEEHEAAKKEEAKRKLELYQSKAAARRATQKKINQKHSDKAQRVTWKNELVAG